MQILAFGLVVVALTASVWAEEAAEHNEEHNAEHVDVQVEGEGHEEHDLGEHPGEDHHLEQPEMDADTFTEQEINEIFTKYDKDHDEKLSVDELTDWLQADVVERMETMDEDTKKEMEELKRSDFAESANDIMEEGDKDQDKFLTREEFDKVMRPQPEDEPADETFPEDEHIGEELPEEPEEPAQ